MIEATTARQKTIRDRASASRTVTGASREVPAEDRRGHRPALDEGDDEADARQGSRGGRTRRRTPI